MTTAELNRLGYFKWPDGNWRRSAPKRQIAPRAKRTFKRFIDADVVSEANRFEHWSKKYPRKKLQCMAVARAFGFELVGLGKPRKVTLVMLSEKQLDSDNLRSATKAHRDQVARLCGFDDREDVWHYDQRRPEKYETRGVWIMVQF